MVDPVRFQSSTVRPRPLRPIGPFLMVTFLSAERFAASHALDEEGPFRRNRQEGALALCPLKSPLVV